MGPKLAVDFNRIDWSQVHWQASLSRVPAIVVLLSLGVLCHQPAAGVLAASTALSTGFAAARKVRESRLLAMIGVVLLMAFSALVGTVAGNFYPAVILTAALWGFASGWFCVLDEDVGWIIMQGVVSLLVATAFPSHGVDALERALFILLGGLVQILSLLALWHWEGISRYGDEFAPPGTPRKTPPSFPILWESFRPGLSFSSPSFRYALRVALTVVMAIELDHLLKLKNGYWLPITTLIVLKPDMNRTYTGGVQRVAGTLMGVIAASLIALVLRPYNFALIVQVGIFGVVTYAFQKASPVIFSAALTASVVFMIAVTGLPEASLTWHRLINTFLGCALALTSRFIGFKFLHPQLSWPFAKDGPL